MDLGKNTWSRVKTIVRFEDFLNIYDIFLIIYIKIIVQKLKEILFQLIHFVKRNASDFCKHEVIVIKVVVKLDGNDHGCDQKSC